MSFSTLDKILSILFKYLFHYNTPTALMSNSSVKPITTIKRNHNERRPSRGSTKNKHKPDKVKQLWRTPSGREPRQKKILKKEDLQSYDRDEILDAMSNEMDLIQENTQVNHNECIRYDQSLSPVVGSEDLIDSNMEFTRRSDEFTSLSSSMDVNLSKEESEETIHEEDKISRLPQFCYSDTEQNDTNGRNISLNSGNSMKRVQTANSKRTSSNKTSRARMATKNTLQPNESSTKLNVTGEDANRDARKYLKSSTFHEMDNMDMCDKCKQAFTKKKNKTLSRGKRNSSRRNKWRSNKSKEKAGNKFFDEEKCTKCGAKQTIHKKNLEQALTKIKSDIKSQENTQTLEETTREENNTDLVRGNNLRSSKSYASATKLNLKKMQIEECVKDEINIKSENQSVNNIPSADTSSLSHQKLENSEASSFGLRNLFQYSNEQSQASENSTSSMGIRHLFESSKISNQSTASTNIESNVSIKLIGDMNDAGTSTSNFYDFASSVDKVDGQFQDISQDLQLQYKQRQIETELSKRVKDLIAREFPYKIEAISQLLAKEKKTLPTNIQPTHLQASYGSFSSTLQGIHSPLTSSTTECMERKVLTVDGNIVELITRVNSYVQSLQQDLGTLKMWIYLVLPKASTPCNADEIMQEINIAEKEASTMQEEILAYYVKRNNVMKEIFKYPQLQNEHILEAINYKQYLELQIMLSILRNKYRILHGVVSTHSHLKVQ